MKFYGKLIILIIFFYFASFNSQSNKAFIPKPWTALKVKTASDLVQVSCWGREYIFDASSVLTQVNVLGQNILEAPINFRIDNKADWNPKKIKLIENTGEKAVLRMEAFQMVNGIRIDRIVDATVYYDGVVFYKIEIFNIERKRSNSLNLNIKLRSEISSIINRFANRSNLQKESWKSDFYQNDNTAYIPYWWIGNGDKGLFWFAESPHNWLDYKNENAIEFRKLLGGIAEIAANFTKENPLLSSTWSFEFGLQATPVKPYNNAFRKEQLIGSGTSTINVVWPDAGKPYQHKYFGYPEPKNPAAFKKHIAQLSTKRKVLLYNSLQYMAADAPEWIENPNWNAGTQDLSADVRAYKNAGFVQANITDATFQTFIISKSIKFIKDYNFDGYYLDYSMLGNLNNNKLIKSFDNGRQKLPYFPIMESRKLHEKFYKAIKALGEDKIIITHSSARVVPPIIAFSDAYVNGEQFRQDITRVADNYLHVTTLTAFQTEFSGKPYGVPGIFLPAYSSENYKVIEPTRHLASLLMLHDIAPWPIYSVGVVWDERFKILNDFPGFRESEFIPYYAEKPFWFSDNPALKVSVYRNFKQELLCIVSNLSSKPLNGNLLWNKLHHYFADYRAVNKTTRGKLKYQDSNAVAISVMPKDFLIFYLVRR